jgi:hypothetical protein
VSEEEVAKDPFTPEERAKLAELEQKHGAVWPLKVDGELVVVRKPTKKEWRAYRDELRDPKTTNGVVEDNFRRKCFAYPEGGTAFDHVTEEYPAIGELISLAITAMANGGRADGSVAVQDLGKDWKRPAATP